MKPNQYKSVKVYVILFSTFGTYIFGSLIWAKPLPAEPITPVVSPANSKVATHDEEQQAKVDAIMRRIHAGDWSAMDDVAAQLDRSAGMQLLSDLVMSQTREDEPFRQAAGRALTKMGAEMNFSAQITRSSSAIVRLSEEYYAELRDREKAFRALQYMHSKKAIAVLVSFLSDEAIPAQRDEDVVESPTCELAAQTLASLGLVDAPKPEHASISTADVEKWRKWWIEHKSQLEHE